MDDITTILNGYIGSRRTLHILNDRNNRKLGETEGYITSFNVARLSREDEAKAYGIGIPTYYMELETEGFAFLDSPIITLSRIRRVHNDPEPLDSYTIWNAHTTSCLFDDGKELMLGISCRIWS